MNYSTADLEIFILTYNRAEFLEQTLISICNQTLKGSRIIVLDNGSTDNTPEVVQKYAKFGVELVRSEKNLGQSYNYSRSQELASRKWVMVFHDDDIMHPTYIETAMGLLKKYPEAVLLGACYIPLETPDNENWKEISTKAVFCETQKDFAALLYSNFAFHFGSAIYRTDLFKSTPFMNNSVYGKIWDRPFLLEIANLGPVIALKASYIRYRCHPGQDSLDTNSGPFFHEWIALQKKYRDILDKNEFDEYGRIFTAYSYEQLLMGYNWMKAEHSKTSFDEFVQKAVKEGALTKLSIFYGKFKTNKIIRGSMRKITRFLVNKKFEYINL